MHIFSKFLSFYMHIYFILYILSCVYSACLYYCCWLLSQLHPNFISDVKSEMTNKVCLSLV